jgi:Ca2+-binding RTX toxin-like protein
MLLAICPSHPTNGDGTFGAATNFAAGTGPFSVKTVDLDGDGKLDLVAGLSVLLGNGDGTFAAAGNFAAGTRPFSIALGDLDGVGGADLAVANYGSGDVSVLLNNSTNLSAVQHTTVTITPVNDAPTITSNGGGNTAAISIAENTTAVTTVTATDPDAGQPLSYSIAGGADAGKFTINSATGALAFVTAPDYEAPTDAGANNVYDVTVQVSDGNGGIDAQAIAVAVQNVAGLTITGTNQADTLTGTGEEDFISGLAGNDTLRGLGGNDILYGGTGKDTMIGGTGNDTYVVDNRGDVVTENSGEGIDTVQSSMPYALGDNLENLTLTGTGNINGTGNASNNVIIGNDGANVLAGLAGADTLNGGDGTDTASYEGSTAGVNVSLATGLGSGGDAQGDTLVNIENLKGSGFNDTLVGNGGDNVLEGLGGADTLNGGDGSDNLTGGAGSDNLTGGAGIDKFVFTAVTDSTPSASDTITDFVHGVDKIDLAGIDAYTTVAGDQAFNGVSHSKMVAPNSVNWFESGGKTFVQADVDGVKATVEFTLVLTGNNLHLTASDFIL